MKFTIIFENYYKVYHSAQGAIGSSPIVSKEWIEMTFQPYIAMSSTFYMGYKWKIGKSRDGLRVYFMNGNGGQIVSILPELNVVIVLTADNRNQKRPLGPLMERITEILK